MNHRKPLTFVLAIFASVFFFTESVIAQSPELAATGTGARSRGMGKAFLAVSDDATAVSWNPAGLVQLMRPEVSIVLMGAAFRNTTSSQPAVSPPDVDKNYGYVDFFSVAYPTVLNDRPAVFAVAYQQQSDFSWIGKKPYPLAQGSTGNDQAEIKGGLYAVSPSFAMQVTDKIWAGAALNIQREKSELTINSGGGQESNSDWGDMRTLNLGVMLNLEQTRIGLIARPRLGGTAVRGLPLTFGLGIAHRPNDNLTIAADIEYARWFDLTPEPGQPGSQVGLTLDRTLDFRAGFEYVKKTDFGGIPLRAGFHSTQSPLRQLVNGRFSGDAPRNFSITAGGGVALAKAAINLAYEIQLKEATDSIAGFRTKDDIKHHRVTVSAVIYLGE